MDDRRRELVPLGVRYAVRDAAGGWGIYTAAEIGELFLVEGFNRASEFTPTASGVRRQEVDAFHAAIDFGSPEQVERYLRVVERVLDDHDNDDGRGRRDQLVKVLRRAGMEPDANGRLRPPPPPLAASARLAAMSSESDIRLHAQRLERLNQEPEELIGAAKELIGYDTLIWPHLGHE